MKDSNFSNKDSDFSNIDASEGDAQEADLGIKGLVAHGLRPWWTLSRLLVLVLLLATVVTVALLLRNTLVDLQRQEYIAKYGYLAIFLVTLVGSASIIVPMPGPIVVFLGGWLLNPILVGLVAGVAEPLGELTGYAAGVLGRGFVERNRVLASLQGWMRRHGVITIFLASLIPNPLVDLVGIAAGAARFPVWKFLAASWAGKTIKSLALASVGHWGVQSILDWIERVPK